MSKVTLSPLTSLTNEPAAISLLNENFDRLEAAIDLMLSRNGASPNTLTADLDMNGFKIINLPTPEDTLDVVRLGDMTTGIVGPTGPQGPSGSVSDGDKGDIVVSSSGTVWTLDSGVVTPAAKTLLNDPTIPDMRATLGLGDSAVLNVGIAAGTVAAGNDSRFSKYDVYNKTADYYFIADDAGRMIRHASGTGHIFTIETYASVPIPVGSVIIVRNAVTSGDITLTPAVGVSLYANGSVSSAARTLTAGSTISLVQEDTDTWVALGTNIA